MEGTLTFAYSRWPRKKTYISDLKTWFWLCHNNNGVLGNNFLIALNDYFQGSEIHRNFPNKLQTCSFVRPHMHTISRFSLSTCSFFQLTLSPVGFESDKLVNKWRWDYQSFPDLAYASTTFVSITDSVHTFHAQKEITSFGKEITSFIDLHYFLHWLTFSRINEDDWINLWEWCLLSIILVWHLCQESH